jgi:hypothetical protein
MSTIEEIVKAVRDLPPKEQDEVRASVVRQSTSKASRFQKLSLRIAGKCLPTFSTAVR